MRLISFRAALVNPRNNEEDRSEKEPGRHQHEPHQDAAVGKVAAKSLAPHRSNTIRASSAGRYRIEMRKSPRADSRDFRRAKRKAPPRKSPPNASTPSR